MADASPLPRPLMLTISALQGLMLFALYRSLDADVWPSQSPLWSYPMWTLAITVPVLLLLSLERGNERRVAGMVGGFGALLALLATYTGWQAEPFGEFAIFSLSGAFALSIAIACFKALMYLQQRAARLPMGYEVLFTYSWRNFLVAAFASLLVLALWLILLLWGELFKVIEIDFFSELFTSDWFLFPVLSLAFGLGVLIFRNLTGVIDGITTLLQGLIKLLLPIVLLVAVIFLVALPFTGLDVLWATGNGTALLLWLTAIILFFSNAVYQDGRGEEPYPLIVHRLIYVALCALPLICALSLYGLGLRLAQYGWSVERCWAFLVWLVLTLFSIGYVVGIVRRRGDWTQMLAKVNTTMGLVVLALMLLANSPLLDFRKIALGSQLARVASGEITLREFDFHYAAQHLGRPGYLALEQMKSDIGDSDPGLREMIDNPRSRMAAERVASVDEFWQRVVYRPVRFEVPTDLKVMIDHSYWGRFGINEAVIIEADLDGDGQHEYAFLTLHQRGIARAEYFYRTADGWQQGQLGFGRGRGRGNGQLRTLDVLEALRNGELTLRKPRFDDLDVGGVLLTPN